MPAIHAKIKTTMLRYGKDLMVVGLIISAVSLWQTRNMLDTDGSIKVSPVTLLDLNGAMHHVAPEPGKQTLLYFFAPWCQICEASIGNLASLDEAKINIVRIALDYESIGHIQQFAERTGVAKPLLIGSSSLQQQMQITGYPSYYLLNDNFEIKDSTMGYTTSVGLKLRTWWGKQ